MNAATYVILCASLFGSTIASKFPSTFQKCKLSDKELEKCLIKAAENGVRQLNFTSFEAAGLKKLEPISSSEATILKGNRSLIDFDQKFSNLNYWGFSNVTFPQFKVDFEKKTTNIDYLFPEILIEYDYDYNGHVLQEYIKGKGPGKSWFEHVCVKTTSTFEEIQKEENKYFHVLSKDFSVDLKQIKVKLENLFDGDQALQDNLNKLLNDKWYELYLDSKAEIDKIFIQVVSSNFENFIATVPSTELFDP